MVTAQSSRVEPPHSGERGRELEPRVTLHPQLADRNDAHGTFSFSVSSRIAACGTVLLDGR